MAFQDLIGKTVSKSIKFLGVDVKITKLSMQQVKDIQARAKEMGEDDAKAMDMMFEVIKMSVEGAEELTTEQFQAWPLEDINLLSEAILTYSGLGKVQAAAKQGA
jgi:hypothetical protein